MYKFLLPVLLLFSINVSAQSYLQSVQITGKYRGGERVIKVSDIIAAAPFISPMLRMSITQTPVIATNAAVTAAAGTAYVLNNGVLTGNQTINVAALNVANDYMEVKNLETGFTWSFTGQSVYLGDGTTTVSTLLIGVTYCLRFQNGKLTVIN